MLHITSRQSGSSVYHYRTMRFCCGFKFVKICENW